MTNPFCEECGRPGYSAAPGGTLIVVGHLDQRVRHAFRLSLPASRWPSPDDEAAVAELADAVYPKAWNKAAILPWARAILERLGEAAK